MRDSIKTIYVIHVCGGSWEDSYDIPMRAYESIDDAKIALKRIENAIEKIEIEHHYWGIRDNSLATERFKNAQHCWASFTGFSERWMPTFESNNDISSYKIRELEYEFDPYPF